MAPDSYLKQLCAKLLLHNVHVNADNKQNLYDFITQSYFGYVS